ncbi:DUF6431 domain-containing protein [Streptomyces canus]|uniref:DUF6431 domain-containing protein n=1 Tax=Streptomyces canus TaxID=58343 RepID=UPI0039A6E89E
MLCPRSGGGHGPRCGGHRVLIVDAEVLLVEQQVREGKLKCPSCKGALAPWGHGRPREVRGDLGARLFVRPRRSRCSSCQVTHVLLPEAIWPRRADAAETRRPRLSTRLPSRGRARPHTLPPRRPSR